MERTYTQYSRSTASALLVLLILLVAPSLRAQVLLDDFNRSNSNTVGGGWTEVQSNGNAAAGARVNGNELILQEPNNNTGREYVWQSAPTSYSSTLSQNNCTLTWAFSFRQTEDQAELTGFDNGDDGFAVVLAGTASDLTTGNGYAVVLGEAGNTDRLRLVRYTGGLDADANVTNIISAGDFATERLDVRVTYVPSTNTWSLFYNDNGGDEFADPLSAATSAGTAANNTYTGTALGFLGVFWNHDGDNGQFGRLDNFFVPAGRPTVPVITPSSATICSNGSTGLSASATTGSSTARVTFYSTGGPSNVSSAGANDGSVYPWGVSVSGIPTSGITVESVTINGVDHTYPDDLDILLQSPTGTNVILMSDVGGSTDIADNTYTFMDGATAMADGTENGSGYYRPTNSGTPDSWPTAPGPNSLSQTTPTLSMFTGSPIGTWNLLIRDDANGDAGTIANWSITFTFTNTVSYTWSPATGLSATTGASVTANPTSTQVYTVTAGHGANSCTQSANVTVTVVTAPTTATVGSDQTICASGSTTGLGGNTPAVGTGSWSVVSGGTGTFSPNNTTPNATFNHTGGTGPITLRWTITGTPPCANSTADVIVTISQPPTTATVGGDQTICANGTTTGLGGNTPTVGSGSWSVVSGGTGTFAPDAITPNATFTHTSGAGPVVLRWTISNSPCTASAADVTITISATCTYYSQSTGNVTDNIWSTLPVGTPGPAFWGASSNMVVKAGHVVTNTSDVNIGSCTVDGTLVLAVAATLTVNDGGLSGTGSLTANDDSELELAGSNPAGISLPGTLSFWNLTISNSNTTTAISVVDIRGTLQLNDGTFDAGTNKVSLRSTAVYTGRMGPVNPAATYTGNMRIERYVPAGATNWRLLGSPITNRRVGNWNDDFTTAGFPGSHVPWFDQPVGSGILWPSIRWYDETNTGAGSNDGMTGVSSNTHSLALGQGFAAWCGTSLTTTTAFTIDLENSTPVIATSPITLPMTYTNTGVPAVDGWNLVSNPLPSPIAFDQIARGADVADYITYFNPAAGNMASYDISSGVSVNGGTNIIQSMQGFFLKASGPAVTTTVDEADKVESNNGGFFGGLEDGVPAVLHLVLNSSINTFSDETLVVFSEGAPEVNGDDVPKYIWSHPDAPQIASMGTAGELIAINAYGSYSTAISIPLMVDAGVSGAYTLTATGLEGLGLSCLSIEDLLTGTTTPLTEGATYTFDMEANADASVPRLMLHATAPLPFHVIGASCHGMNDGEATVEVMGGTADVALLNDVGGVIAQLNAVSGVQTLNDLAAGDYQVQVDGFGGCGTLSHVFTVEQPEALSIEGTSTDASCPNTTDGQVTVSVSGGTAPYALLWSNGGTGTMIAAGAGSYDVNVIDANGCALQSGTFSIESGSGPDAAADAQSVVVTVNEPVLFINNSTAGTAYFWEFGDGATSTDAAPEHAYALPGEYNVVLTVIDGLCLASATITIIVETSTGIEEANRAHVAAWMNGDNLVVEHGFTNLEPVHVEILNEAGQLFRQQKVAGPSGRLTIPAADLASGIWYVRVSNMDTRRTIPVVVVR
ncbi:MAG: proprotein convertase P-domain-containing protein [Flavobacteriales bacterium]|nr:proprotein convertase P-domain-containing protein [Flavobacteriales bacterium]